MKSFCVAVFVLSLTSVCQPASLACEQLLKPADRSPDLLGTWYIIAMSSDILGLLNSLFSMSGEMTVTPGDTPNLYNGNIQIKMSGHCFNISGQFLYENSSIFDADSNNAPTGEADVLLQTGCTDCIVIKSDSGSNTFLLLSKRKNVTDAELKEAEAQIECLGWSKLEVFSTDHDQENCDTLDPKDFHTSTLLDLIYERLKTYTEYLSHLTERALYYPRLAYEWAQKYWSWS